MLNVDITPKGVIVLSTPVSEFPTSKMLKLTVKQGQETSDHVMLALEEAVIEAVRDYLGLHAEENIVDFYGIADEVCHFLNVEAINCLVSKIRSNITDTLKPKGVVSFELKHHSKLT